MKIFGFDFKNLSEESIQDLFTLEREKAIYSDQWIDGLDDFRHVRIRLKDPEIIEYVRSMKALDLFLRSGAQRASDVEGIPADIAARADAYQITTIDGDTFRPPWHCPAAFMGHELEALVCSMGNHTRQEVLEEQGTAAFLSTIRRAADALTPAIRCFTSREKSVIPWPIAREDDIRDLLYAMLRASISDIKREEPVPSRGGTSRVADLHSGLAKTLLEIKWVGKKGQWRRILDEIHVDIQTYGRHPDCHHLVFIIVDAVRDIPDPHLIEEDFSGTQVIDNKSIRVLIYVREP
jgi:hypothetical protein